MTTQPRPFLPSRAARAVLLVSFAALIAPALPVLRSAHGEDKAMAVSLFDEGKKLMEAGKYDEACKKLEASRKADPSADGVVLRLALCYQALDRHATAWALFKESLVRGEKAKRKDRVDASKKGIAETEAKMTRVTINVTPEARVAGLQVSWDDKPLDEGTWGSAFPVDPGAHKLTASAPGKKAFETTVQVGPTAEKKTVDVPKLEPEAKPAPVASASTAPAPSTSATAPVPSALPPDPHPTPVPKKETSYVLPLIVGGVGVAALGVGAYFGLGAKSDLDASKNECRADNRCTPAGIDARNDAIHKANLSTWTFVVGGVLVASALTWVIVSSSSNKTQVGLVPGGLVLAGTFR